MMQIIEQTQKEKEKMYMKLPKKEIVKILIECNKHLSSMVSFKIKDSTNDEEIHKMD